jgi:hypothetical protein
MSVDGSFYGMEGMPLEVEALLATLIGVSQQVVSRRQGPRPLTELEVYKMLGQALSSGVNEDEIYDCASAFLGAEVCPTCPLFPTCEGGPEYVEASKKRKASDFIDYLILLDVLPNGDPKCPFNKRAEERLSSVSGRLKANAARFGQSAGEFRRGLNEAEPIDNPCSCSYCKGMRTRLRLDTHTITRWPLERFLAFWNVVWPPKAEEEFEYSQGLSPGTADVMLIII